jgi:hypothetical protein
MSDLILHVLAWPTVLIALGVFGFAPGAVLRLIVLAYRREDPRRRELISELYHVPRIERPFWVAEQLETALFDGCRGRLAAAWRARRPVSALIRVEQPGRGRVLTLKWKITPGCLGTIPQTGEIMPALLPALGQAVTIGRARPVHFVQCGNYGPHRKADLAVLLFHLRDALAAGAWHMAGAGCPEPGQRVGLVLSLLDGKGSLPGDDGPCPVCGTMCD